MQEKKEEKIYKYWGLREETKLSLCTDNMIVYRKSKKTWQTIKTNSRAQQGNLIFKKYDIHSNNKNDPVPRNTSDKRFVFWRKL